MITETDINDWIMYEAQPLSSVEENQVFTVMGCLELFRSICFENNNTVFTQIVSKGENFGTTYMFPSFLNVTVYNPKH
jgi:hypothetical protein